MQAPKQICAEPECGKSIASERVTGRGKLRQKMRERASEKPSENGQNAGDDEKEKIFEQKRIIHYAHLVSLQIHRTQCFRQTTASTYRGQS